MVLKKFKKYIGEHIILFLPQMLQYITSMRSVHSSGVGLCSTETIQTVVAFARNYLSEFKGKSLLLKT